jgi:hypothetical protein
MQGTHFTTPAPGGSIKRKVVNPDLQEERDKCKFDVEDVKKIIVIKEISKKYDEIAEDWRKNPDVVTTHKYFEMTRMEQMEHDWKIFKRLVQVNP